MLCASPTRCPRAKKFTNAIAFGRNTNHRPLDAKTKLPEMAGKLPLDRAIHSFGEKTDLPTGETKHKMPGMALTEQTLWHRSTNNRRTKRTVRRGVVRTMAPLHTVPEMYNATGPRKLEASVRRLSESHRKQRKRINMHSALHCKTRHCKCSTACNMQDVNDITISTQHIDPWSSYTHEKPPAAIIYFCPVILYLYIIQDANTHLTPPSTSGTSLVHLPPPRGGKG